MNNNILALLRSFSLRKVIGFTLLSVFVIAIACVIVGIKNGNSDSKMMYSMGLISVISTIGSLLIYTTFVAQAVGNDNKAIVTSWIFIVAYVISLIGSFSAFSDAHYDAETLGVDFTRMDMAFKTYPYMMLTSLITIGGMLYSAKEVRQKFKVAWWIFISASAISGCGALSLCMSIFNYEAYETCTNIGAVVSLIFIIILFYIGKQEPAGQYYNDTDAANVSPKEVSSTSAMKNKTQELMKLKELLNANILTQDEFDREKAKILNS